MNDVQLLERLMSAYATVQAPPPSPALADVLESGGRATDDEARDANVVPFDPPAPRRGVRMRYLVAALVAMFVLSSGLSVAGALPDPLQRGVSSVVAHLGIDLPHPDASPAGGRGGSAPGAPARTRPSPTSSADIGDGASGPGATAPSPDPTTAPTGLAPGDAGATGGASVPTTQPPGGDGVLPPLSGPDITLPPVTVPQVTLSPLTLPSVTVPPVTLPGL